MSSDQPWDHLARLVAGRQDTLRVFDGSTYRGVPWPGREPDVPYAVHLHDEHGRVRTLAFDLDAKDPSMTLLLQRDLIELRLLLGEADIRSVETLSGPSGGRHVLVPFAEPLPHAAVRAVVTALSKRLQTLDPSPLLNTATGALRPPGAPHRSGGRSELVGSYGDAVSLFAVGNDVAGLERLVGLLDIDRRVLRPARSPLSPRLWRMLRFGHGLDSYRSMSEAVIALFVSTLSRQYDPRWVEKQLKNPVNQMARMLVGHRRQDGSPRDVTAMITAARTAAERFVSQSPPVGSSSETIELLAEIEAQLVSMSWTGRRGLSALSLAHAFLVTARNAKSLTVNLSQRRAAELAGLRTRKTVASAIDLLVSVGFLRLERRAEGRLASTWRICRPSACRTEAQQPLEVGPLTHPVFGWREMGKAAGRVVEVLRADGPSTTGWVARRTGLHPGTVTRSLRRLSTAEIPLVSRSGTRWACLPLEDRSSEGADPPAPGDDDTSLLRRLDELADLTGARAELDRLVVRHELERQAWHRWLEQRRAARAGPAAA